MPIAFTPAPGTVLRCDFTRLEEPEMVKYRPVVVLSPRRQRERRQTVLVVPLSTTPPNFVRPHHLNVMLPGTPPANLIGNCWVKGDMLYSVALKRLDLYRTLRNSEGSRSYYTMRFDAQELRKIREAAGQGIGLTF